MKSWYDNFRELPEEAKEAYNKLTEEEVADQKKMWVESNLKGLVRDLDDLVNRCGKEESNFVVEHISRFMHRSLQQDFFFQVIVPLIQKWADNFKNGDYDPRNQATCKICNNLIDTLKREL